MAKLWSLKVSNHKEHNSKKTVVYCKFEEIKAKVGKVGFFTSNNFNVISFEINQRKTFSLSDKTHFFSLLYEEKLVISTLQTKCSQWKRCREPFFSFYAGSVNIVQNENNSFEM